MESLITLYEMGIVIVGQNHNPSILNPDFLWRKEIVSEETKHNEGSTFSTPVASQCIFENGLQIISEPNRISFLKTGIETESPLCYDTAKKYLRIVPLVHYTAVGINFSGFGDTFAPHNMLSDKSRNKYKGIDPSAEITLTYPLPDTAVNLTVKSTRLEDKEKVVVHGNFHHGINADEGESYKVAIATADDWRSDLECFEVLVKNIAKSIGE